MIRVVAVGRLQPMYKPLQDEFLKRLTRYARVEMIEVPDEPAPEKLSEAQKHAVQMREWEKIEKKRQSGETLILLDGRGKSCSSEQFAQTVRSWQEDGNVLLALGGSWGFPDEARACADGLISLSEMTMTHSMARCFLLEQLYRGFRILNHEPYHK